MQQTTALREATLNDLGAMLALEQTGFSQDRFDEEQLRYLLTEAHATTFVAEVDGHVRGYAMTLWRGQSPTGHLYSIVTDPECQGRGIGSQLLAACEEAGVRRGCGRITLEVRPDNPRAIALYERHGYRRNGTLGDFYEDGSYAIRMEKRLEPPAVSSVRLRVPYYSQTLGFTCGPACLMMAMRHFTPGLKINRALELVLWKEATTVYMTSGLGGCDAIGLAVAARRRGYTVKVVLSERKTPFVSSVRSSRKKEVIRLVHEHLKREARSLGVTVAYYGPTVAEMTEALRRGVVPIVLVSAYRIHEVRGPHWVVVTGFDRRKVYFHDPFAPSYEEDGKRPRNVGMPVAEFRKICRYGTDVRQSTVFIGRAD